MRRRMRVPEKSNAIALGVVALVFYALALTRVGEVWEQRPEVRDLYLWVAMFMTVFAFVLRRAEFGGIPSLDRWVAAIWVMVGFSLFGLAPLWPVLLLGLVFGGIVRLEARLAFQSSEELAQALGVG